MAQDPFAVPSIQAINMEGAKAQLSAQNQSAIKAQISQEASAQSLQSFIDEGAFSPSIMTRRFETLETRKRQTSKDEEAEKAAGKEILIKSVERNEKTAQDFNKRNQELDPKSLILLRSRLNPNDSKEQILEKVLELYPDPWLADEALDFLSQTTEGDLLAQVKLAREDHNAAKGQDIRAGKNIQAQAQDAANQKLGAPTELRSLYKEVTTNPRDANTLFNELSSHLEFDKMKTLIAFLLHSLGSDLKSKGPSIPSGELYTLFTEARKLQAILGIFYFFKGRMPLILSEFQRQGLTFTLNFEILAKQLMRLIQEKYPSADRVLSLASNLGISNQLLAQIILFAQMRDAMRNIAPRLFRSNQHRQDLLNAFLDALEELDEQLEEEAEKDEDSI